MDKFLAKMKDPKIIVGIIVAILGGLVGVNYVEGQTIYFDDGTVYEVPDDKRLRVVPKGTSFVCWTLDEKVKMVNPKTLKPREEEPKCTPPGELVISPSVPCEE